MQNSGVTKANFLNLIFLTFRSKIRNGKYNKAMYLKNTANVKTRAANISLVLKSFLLLFLIRIYAETRTKKEASHIPWPIVENAIKPGVARNIRAERIEALSFFNSLLNSLDMRYVSNTHKEADNNEITFATQKMGPKILKTKASM